MGIFALVGPASCRSFSGPKASSPGTRESAKMVARHIVGASFKTTISQMIETEQLQKLALQRPDHVKADPCLCRLTGGAK
jgi:hypothetical protein